MAIRPDTNIPGEVYVQFVKSLYESRNTLLVGATSHMLVALVVYFSTGHIIFAVFAILFMAIGLVRFVGISRDGHLLNDPITANQWELDYVFNAGIQGFLLGFFAFFCSYVYPTEFGELGSLSIILASLATVVGRNYGSSRVVVTFTVTMLAPVVLAYLLRLEFGYIILALLMYPFGMIVIKSAAEIRKILVSAVIERSKADQLAQRFDRALNTMSHGLIMFNTSGHVVVANDRTAEFLGFRNSDQLIGRTLDALLLRGVAGHALSRKDFIDARAELVTALNTGKGRKVLLRLRDGRYLEFTAREGREELAVLTFEEVTQRVEAEEQIRHMARYDSLTGLPNRGYFQELVRGYMGRDNPNRLCGLAIIDLDDFKAINDSLGHPVGDSLIYTVAERLLKFETNEVKIGRFGGDEFMIYFDHIADTSDFNLQFSSLFDEVQGEVEIAGNRVMIQISAGAVVLPASDGDLTATTVMADLALYNAKDAGKNRWSLYEDHMDEAFRTRQRMKSDLRSAIQENQLYVAYQPIVNLDTLKITGCEALCRWEHSELGAISPAVFIPLAEEMGLITEISEQVLKTACIECTKWPEHYSVSVNLSAKDFHSADVVGKVLNALQISGLEPKRLELEVTETALLDDRNIVQSCIKRLHDIGVCIALDDFGTGYSSLSYLHMLPLDRLKIDGSFLHDITLNERSQKLLQSVVQLARSIGLSVTVEGVETEAQLKLLAELIKPDNIQGFLFAKAETSEQIMTNYNTGWKYQHQHSDRIQGEVVSPLLLRQPRKRAVRAKA